MVDIIISLPPDLLEEIERLAKEEERTRRAQVRYLLRLGLEVAKARRQGLPGAEAAGPRRHQPHQGGEVDVPKE